MTGIAECSIMGLYREEEVCIMIAKLIMQLECENGKRISFHRSSLLQGVIMEYIDSEYAERLHEPKLNPYAQGVYIDKEKVFWVITALNEEAYEKIILPMYDEAFNGFTFNKSSERVRIVDKKVEKRNMSELLDGFYSDEYPRNIEIAFLTPTAFKSKGAYIYYPDLRLIFQSLMMKYNLASNTMEMFDDDTLDQIVSMCYVSSYNLKSIRFPMEKIKIPSFVGKINISIRGTTTMARYARMLLEYGEYSGVGIKTAIGMGMMKIKGVRM